MVRFSLDLQEKTKALSIIYPKWRSNLCECLHEFFSFTCRGGKKNPIGTVANLLAGFAASFFF